MTRMEELSVETGIVTGSHGSHSSIAVNRLLRRWTAILPVALVILEVQVAFAQIDTARTGADELFKRARALAHEGQRPGARKLCEAILLRDPGYDDARVLLGRTYAWDGQWKEARSQILRVLAHRPDHRDAVSALVDVGFWSQKPDDALQAVLNGLRSFPNDESLLFEKARALGQLGRYREALASLEQLEQLNPSRADASALRREIQMRRRMLILGADYATDRFSASYNPMHYGMVQAGTRTENGLLILRANYANKFQTSGIQVESEFYPSLGGGTYAYLNYGYSNAAIFPMHRAGAELFGRFPLRLEGSLGVRYLYFTSTNTIVTYTGSVGWYVSTYWFSLRPYLSPVGGGTARSMTLTIRRYFGSSEDFLSFRGNLGVSPDERLLQTGATAGYTQVFELKSQGGGLLWQYSLSDYTLLVASLDYTNQELVSNPGQFIQMYSAVLGVRIKL